MKITVIRDAAEQSYEQSYELPDTLQGASVSNALQYISRHIDASLAYYLSCRRGMCAACVVRIHGRNEMACVVEVADGMIIAPTQARLLVKDTVVHLGMPAASAFDIREAFQLEGEPK